MTLEKGGGGLMLVEERQFVCWLACYCPCLRHVFVEPIVTMASAIIFTLFFIDNIRHVKSLTAQLQCVLFINMTFFKIIFIDIYNNSFFINKKFVFFTYLPYAVQYIHLCRVGNGHKMT